MQPSTLGPTAEVLGAFRIQDATVSRIQSGRANAHWRLETPEGQRYVLRRYHPRRTAGSIEWEHAALSHAESKGWPVAAAVRVRNRTVQDIDGVQWSLFPFLTGSTVETVSPGQAAVKGRLLARLHEDMTGLLVDGQRPGFGRAWELDLFVGASGTAATFNELLRRFASQHYDLARGLRGLKYRSLRELARLGYGDLPARFVHCDFHSDNLLFQSGSLSAALDFDSARLDAVVYDVACSVAQDCLQEPSYDGISPELAAGFVRGYAGHRTLDEVEAQLLIPLVRACWLQWAIFRLEQWVAGEEPERAVASITRTLQRRIPALDAITPLLSRRLTEAALSPR